ncbi:adenosine 5'-monophosphoramidase HINT3-like isoform X2 [Uloborus diversus]|uniref:adenosine 5'-monophosphoramidase HINT3-like isoform X2 n=1 Tax=Uloborus diversus TaxID=327109 RepID=UPI002409E181|nr:adenosine 5'-monophosphoramidase HINT3-like isoform X2 [Uloborus diversus]
MNVETEAAECYEELFPALRRQKECVFCCIAYGEDPSTSILYEDDNFVAFPNITPAATHHYLIIPKEHIRDGSKLSVEYIPKLRMMEAIGRNVLAQQGAGAKSQSDSGFILYLDEKIP